MAEFKRKSDLAPAEDLTSRRRSELATRQEMGIETLADDEELIGDDMFSEMHESLVTRRATLQDQACSESEADQPGLTETPTVPPDDELQELLLEELASELPFDGDRGAPLVAAAVDDPPNSPAEAALLEAQMQGAPDRESVARLALRLAGRFAKVSALLVANRGVIAGLQAQGEGVEERIRGVMISSSVEGLMAHVVESGKSCLASGPYHGMDARVLDALGRREAQEVLVVPIVIRGRVVNLLYADNGSDSMPVTSIAALRALARCIGSAYEALILHRKQAQEGASEPLQG